MAPLQGFLRPDLFSVICEAEPSLSSPSAQCAHRQDGDVLSSANLLRFAACLRCSLSLHRNLSVKEEIASGSTAGKTDQPVKQKFTFKSKQEIVMGNNTKIAQQMCRGGSLPIGTSPG
jgi:hypothetical protein